jgi:hypothetical protein
MKIQPIVEGHGEVSAVPVLLRRLIAEAEAYRIKVNPPIRSKQSQLLKQDGLRRWVQLAMKQEDCRGILILFENEDGCPKELGPKLQAWARAESGALPCTVALAHREYEAWFLASVESLRGKRGIRRDAESHPQPESVRDAKGALEERMESGSFYSETADQVALSALFDMKAAYSKSRSFRHLVGALGDLIRRMGENPGAWPPAEWIAE